MADVNQGLKWTFGADVSDLTAGLKRVSKEFDKTAKASKQSSETITKSASSMNAASSALKSLGKAALVFAGAKKLTQFATAAVDAGGQMEKLRRVSTMVFGDMSDAAEAFARDSAKAYGLTNQEALTFVNSYGRMLTGMGKSGKDAAAMSMELSKLAGNLSHINDMQPEDTFQAIQAGISGAIQPLKRLGYDLSVANLQQYMYNMGIKEKFKDLNTTSQMMVRYNYLLHLTSGLQDANSVSANTWAGQMTLLRQQWASFSANMGEAITIVFMPVIKVLNMIVGALVRATQAFVIFMRTLFGIEPPAVKAAEAVQSIPAGISADAGKATKGLKKMRQEVNKLMGIDELNIIPSDKEPASGGVSGGGGGAPIGGLDLDLGIDYSELDKASKYAEEFRKKWENVAESVLKYREPITAALAAIGTGLLAWVLFKNWGTVGPLVGTVLGGIWKGLVLLTNPLAALKGLFSGLWGIVSAGGTLVWNVFSGMLAPIKFAATYVWEFILVAKEFGFVNTLTAELSRGFTLLGQALSAPMVAATLVATVIVALGAAIIQLWKTNEDFKEALVNAWKLITDVIKNAWDTALKPVLQVLGEAFLFVWSYGIKPLWDGWVEFVRIAIMAITDLWVSLQPIVMWMVDTFGPVIVAIVELVAKTFAVTFAAIGRTVGFTFRAIGEAVDSLIGVFSGLIDIIVGVFSGDWDKAWSGVVKIFDKTFGKVFNITKNIWGKTMGLFKGGGKIFNGITEGIISMFKSIVNGILTGINKIISIPFNSLNAVLNGIRSISILGAKPFQGLWGYSPVPVPQIPKFASGGVVFGETMGIVGEYEGARTNPEVIAPLDKLQALLDKGESIDPMDVQEILRLLRLISIKDPSIILDGDKINRVNKRRDDIRSRKLGRVV